MTVYVDDMYKHPIGHFGRMKMSHMVADTFSELHDMADKIGLARKWFQGDHYDVSMSLRRKAIAAGAVEIPYGANVARIARKAKLIAVFG